MVDALGEASLTQALEGPGAVIYTAAQAFWKGVGGDVEVQADLIRLDKTGHLPLPWSIRAHLGLESGTGVTIVLTRPTPGKDRIPDILVTPLTPHRLNCTFSVELVVPEQEGAIRDVLSFVTDDANVVLSDTITLEGRVGHKLNLVIEPAFGNPTPEEFEATIAQMFESAGAKPVVTRVYPSRQPFELEEPLRIDKAYIKWSGWRQIINRDYPTDVGKYDLERVVVSSNPDQRLLRYIFPRNGVVQITAPHNNLPGALRAITGAISKSGYNILSSRLSRTPRPRATERMSVFVAVCEPAGKKAAPPEALKAAVQAIPNIYITKRCEIDFGAAAGDTRYLVPRGSRMIRPPADLKARVLEERVNARIACGTTWPTQLFFLSYRFVAGKTADQNVLVEHRTSLDIIRRAVRHAGGAIVEAPPNFEAETSREAIYPKLWAADACLVLALDENGDGKLSLSQAHEVGFFLGQRKPLMIFVERGRGRDVTALGNMDGYIRTEYDRESFEVRESNLHTSLYVQVRHYAYALAEQEGQVRPQPDA